MIAATDARDETIYRLRQGISELIESSNTKQKRIAELEALLVRVLRGEADAA